MINPTYPEVCTASIKNIEKEIDRLTEISGLDSIPAWMVKDLIAKAHYQGILDHEKLCRGLIGGIDEVLGTTTEWGDTFLTPK